MSENVNRQLSLHFSTKFFKGIKHEEVLSAIEYSVERNHIKSVQITESDCVISLDDAKHKEKLMSRGLQLKNRSVSLVDIEKQLTNITIKDLPYELSDMFLITNLSKYGQVIQGSVKRGFIRDTQIENGTRYAQLLDCVAIIPNRTKFGRHEVRLFADNNRTACSYCSKTDHPSFRCKKSHNPYALVTIVKSRVILPKIVLKTQYATTVKLKATLKEIVRNTNQIVSVRNMENTQLKY